LDLVLISPSVNDPEVLLLANEHWAVNMTGSCAGSGDATSTHIKEHTMNNEQRIQLHNEMVRAQLRAEAQAEADKRTHKRAQERLSRQINCVQNRSRGQSDREKWGHIKRTPMVDWDVNND